MRLGQGLTRLRATLPKPPVKLILSEDGSALLGHLILVANEKVWTSEDAGGHFEHLGIHRVIVTPSLES